MEYYYNSIDIKINKIVHILYDYLFLWYCSSLISTSYRWYNWVVFPITKINTIAIIDELVIVPHKTHVLD